MVKKNENFQELTTIPQQLRVNESQVAYRHFKIRGIWHKSLSVIYEWAIFNEVCVHVSRHV